MLLRRSLIMASLLCLTVVSACTTTSAGEPQPDSTGNTTSASSDPADGDEELPFAGAPKVDNALDTSLYEQDPCQSLTSDQTQTLNLPATGQAMKNVALGKGCTWFNEETRGEAIVSFFVDDPRGLSPEYEANNDGEWAYFKELPEIGGYPAVARSATDARDSGRCSVVVGVADDMAFAASVRLSQANVGQNDPCEVAVRVAGLALETMKAGA